MNYMQSSPCNKPCICISISFLTYDTYMCYLLLSSWGSLVIQKRGMMMSKTRLINLMVVTLISLFPTFLSAGTIQLPQTGQTKCYDSAGTEISCATTGQDGAYTINPVSFTGNGNGTVTDNNINLIFNNVLAGASENIIRASISSIGVEGNAKSDNP